MRSSVNINLTTDKLLIRLNEKCEHKEIMAALKKKIVELKKLYQNDKTPIYVVGKVLKNAEMEDIQNLIQGAIDVKVDFESPKTLGLAGIKKSFNKEIKTSETKFQKGSLRSGNKIEYEGSIVVLGDVNSGAEVVAGENIVVVGALRGLAHAGAKGNKDAIIEASEIDAVQIRIADKIKEIEKSESEIKQIRTSAYINDKDELILE